MVVSSETPKNVVNHEECPFCGSEDIEVKLFEGGGDEVWQRVSCIDCGGRWTDVYQHVKREMGETSDKESENE